MRYCIAAFVFVLMSLPALAQTDCYQLLLAHAVDMPLEGQGQRDSLTQTRSRVLWGYKDGKLHGRVVGLFYNGDTMFVAHFNNGNPVGHFVSYNQTDGAKIAEGNYNYANYLDTLNTNGPVQRISIEVNALGIVYNLWRNATTASTIRLYGNVGTWDEYYCSGQLKMQYNMAEQTTKSFDPTGDIWVVTETLPNGEQTHNQDGELVHKIEYYPGHPDRILNLFKNGKYAIKDGTGVDTVYASHGEVARIVPYKKGYVTGKVIFFSLMGKPLKECKYKKGEQKKCRSLVGGDKQK